MTIQDRRSDKLIDSLRGYTRRQPWVKDDLLVLQLLFDNLDQAEATIQHLEQQQSSFVAQHKKICESYERRLEYLEYRVKEEQNKGMWAYLKMLVGPCH